MSQLKAAYNAVKASIKGDSTRIHNDSIFDGPSLSTTSFSNDKTKQEKLDIQSVAKVLVIGETGAGKSTFINYLTNYFRQGSLQDLKIAIPSKYRPHVTESFSHSEHNMQNTTQSKTDGCHQYMFVKGEKQYMFLDTPGLSDTRGTEQDNINISKIVDAVEGLSGLTAVIIVVNGAVARLTVNLQNVITRLRGNLPDIVMDNVIVVLTNSTRYVANFTLQALELHGNVYPYYMQNSAFSSDPSTWNKSSALDALQYDWNQAMEEFDAMIGTLDQFKTKSVAAFKTMRDIRNEIKALMHNAQLEVTKIQSMQDEIAAFDTALKQANTDLVTYKDYTKERTIEVAELVDASYHSTLCQTCNHVCHDKCGLTETTTVGDQIFQRCWAISSGQCKQCPGNCSYTLHYHAKKTVNKVQKTLKDVMHDIKAKYDKASNDQSSYAQKIKTTDDAKKLLEKALNQKKNEIINLCKKLQAICSGFNLAQELHALIHQLEIQASMLRNIDAKQQATTFIRSLKEFCQMLEREQGDGKVLSSMKIINTDRPERQRRGVVISGTPASSTRLSSDFAPENKTSSSIPDIQSHANEQVLSALRAISNKKSTHQRKNDKKKRRDTKSSPEVSASESSDTSTVESDESDRTSDSSEPKVLTSKVNPKEGKNRRKKTDSKTKVENNEQYKELTVDELLTQCRACKDRRRSNFIIHELTQRSLGKSTGPLKTPASIADFTSSMQKYTTHNPTELHHDYEKLKERITAITEPDVLNIGKVDSSLLLEIAAVYILMRRTPLEASPPPPYSNTVRDPQYTGIHSHQVYPFPAASYFRPPAYHQEQYPPYVLPGSSPFMNAASGAYPNLPPRHDPHIRNEIPFYHASPSEFHHNYYDRNYPLNSYPTQVSHPRVGYPQQSAFHPIDPPSRRLFSPHESLQLSDTFQGMTLSRSPISSDGYRQSTLPANNHQSPLSSSGSIINEHSACDLRQMTDSQLLAAHSEALNRQNYDWGNALYSELKLRCSGDHPILIKENQTLFDQKLHDYQERSYVELKQAQVNILSKVKQYLNGDNAIHLNQIPTELIIEAGVLARLVGFMSI